MEQGGLFNRCGRSAHNRRHLEGAFDVQYIPREFHRERHHRLRNGSTVAVQHNEPGLGLRGKITPISNSFLAFETSIRSPSMK